MSRRSGFGVGNGGITQKYAGLKGLYPSRIQDIRGGKIV